VKENSQSIFRKQWE